MTVTLLRTRPWPARPRTARPAGPPPPIVYPATAPTSVRRRHTARHRASVRPAEHRARTRAILDDARHVGAVRAHRVSPLSPRLAWAGPSLPFGAARGAGDLDIVLDASWPGPQGKGGGTGRGGCLDAVGVAAGVATLAGALGYLAGHIARAALRVLGVA